MATSELLRDYEQSEELVKALYNSKLRLGILSALKENPMTLSDLRRAVDANAPNTSSKGKDLEELGLVERKSGVYELTDLGFLALNEISNSFKNMSKIEKYKEFWKTHDMSNIPHEMQSELISNDDWIFIESPKDISDTEEQVMMILSTLKPPTFCGGSYAFRKDWVDLMTKKCREGVHMKFIFHEEVIKLVGKHVKEQGYDEWLDKSKIEVFHPAFDFNLGIALSTEFTGLIFRFKETKDLDDLRVFYGPGKRCVDWGKRLFEYFESKSTQVDMSKYV